MIYRLYRDNGTENGNYYRFKNTLHNWGEEILRTRALFGGSYDKDYNRMGSILGKPYLGKLPFVLLGFTAQKQGICQDLVSGFGLQKVYTLSPKTCRLGGITPFLRFCTQHVVNLGKIMPTSRHALMPGIRTQLTSFCYDKYFTAVGPAT